MPRYPWHDSSPGTILPQVSLARFFPRWHDSSLLRMTLLTSWHGLPPALFTRFGFHALLCLQEHPEQSARYLPGTDRPESSAIAFRGRLQPTLE